MAHGPRTHCLDRSMYTPKIVKLQDGESGFFGVFKGLTRLVDRGDPSMKMSPTPRVPFKKKGIGFSEP